MPSKWALPPASCSVTAAALVARAAEADGFTGKSGSSLDIIAPSGLKAARLVVIGCGKASDLKAKDFLKLGGIAAGKVPAAAKQATIVAELPAAAMSPEAVAGVALGATLRSYSFDRYKTKKKEGEDKRAPPSTSPSRSPIPPPPSEPGPTARAWPKGWCGRATSSTSRPTCSIRKSSPAAPRRYASWAFVVDVLDVRAMKRLGMNSLLGVGQGSVHESRVVIMRWNGGKRGATPVAFIGKGVCFDTGGISIKAAAGMEDMKGDMAGAATVVGLMHALASRKAKVNAIGAIGIVENMPDGNAQRPGDIVKSMSGQTIEIINTDAEGRLVLADVLHYVNTRYKPQFMIDLATLTGAIMVALGQEYAGLFANDDKLVDRLVAAGEETGERVWRMPLGARIRQDDRFEVRRHEEYRRPSRRCHHRRATSRPLRRQDPLGPSRHRGHGARLAAVRYQQGLDLGLGRAAARSARQGPLRKLRPAMPAR